MKNLIFKLTGEAGVRLLSTVFILLLARAVGAADFGRYSSVFAFASIFMIVVDLGTNSIVTREIARQVMDRPLIVGSTNTLKLLATLVALALAHGVARLKGWPHQQVMMVDALTLVAINYIATDYFSALLNGKEEMGWEAILKVSCRFCVIGAGLAAVFLQRSLLSITLWMGAAQSSVSL